VLRSLICVPPPAAANRNCYRKIELDPPTTAAGRIPVNRTTGTITVPVAASLRSIKTMQLIDTVRNMYADPDFIPFSRTSTKRLCYPNRLFYADKQGCRLGVLTTMRKPPRTHWSINKSGLDYLLAAEQEQRIHIGFVTLSSNGIDDKPKVIAVASAMQVAHDLSVHPCCEGRWNSHWWVNEHFKCDDALMFEPF
jgi:hypothetical protein